MKSNTSSNLKLVLLIFAFAFAGQAMAQSSAGLVTGICSFVAMLRGIVGAVALLALISLGIAGMFGKGSVIGDIVEKILITCALIGFGSLFINPLTGSSC